MPHLPPHTTVPLCPATPLRPRSHHHCTRSHHAATLTAPHPHHSSLPFMQLRAGHTTRHSHHSSSSPTECIHIYEELTSLLQPCIDVVRTVHLRIVDQPLHSPTAQSCPFDNRNAPSTRWLCEASRNILASLSVDPWRAARRAPSASLHIRSQPDEHNAQQTPAPCFVA